MMSDFEPFLSGIVPSGYLYLDGETPKYFLKTVLKYLALSKPTADAASDTGSPRRSNAAERSSRMMRMKSCGDLPVQDFSFT